MRKLILLTVLTACSLAAPTVNENDAKEKQISLQRPSPINPDVISDPKPPEKITVITDPKEIARHKREEESTIKVDLQYPPQHSKDTPQQPTETSTVKVPEKPKRDLSHKQATTDELPIQLPERKLATPHNNENKESESAAAESAAKKRTKRNSDKLETPPIIPPVAHTTPTIPEEPKRDVLDRPKRNVQLPEATWNQGVAKPQTLEGNVPQTLESHVTPSPHDLKTETQPETRTVSKRDIPVPLVAKHKHSEESSEESGEKKSKQDDPTAANDKETKKGQPTEADKKTKRETIDATEDSSSTSSTTDNSLLRPKPSPVAELFPNKHT